MAAESLPAKAYIVYAERARAEAQKNRVGKHYRLRSATSLTPGFGFFEHITMASVGKLWKAEATIGLRRPPGGGSGSPDLGLSEWFELYRQSAGSLASL